ncbi:hypothetical protein AMAG_04570 [Allomyces macrogynus ATCC 38327]|uniref:Uncharacterized protein n=1 Tax=Allomyces macrogynus (strain ATCC 38327) TaxID=578462 RepID=A0A0L0S598_ALLM3|nr:hypothetical protein AMAG_04570 [Allomyces macrogynus ATCC 38327]|eukprot:KNE57713.1 hypothetical protein AMAG_04570 [Allomyces macrogynus ATCC 38327]
MSDYLPPDHQQLLDAFLAYSESPAPADPPPPPQPVNAGPANAAANADAAMWDPAVLAALLGQPPALAPAPAAPAPAPQPPVAGSTLNDQVVAMLAQTIASNQHAQQVLLQKLDEQAAHAAMLARKLADVERRTASASASAGMMDVDTPLATVPSTPSAAAQTHPFLLQQQQQHQQQLQYHQQQLQQLQQAQKQQQQQVQQQQFSAHPYAAASAMSPAALAPAITYTPSHAFSRLSMHASHDAPFSPLTSPALHAGGPHMAVASALLPLPPSQLGGSMMPAAAATPALHQSHFGHPTPLALQQQQQQQVAQSALMGQPAQDPARPLVPATPAALMAGRIAPAPQPAPAPAPSIMMPPPSRTPSSTGKAPSPLPGSARVTTGRMSASPRPQLPSPTSTAPAVGGGTGGSIAAARKVSKVAKLAAAPYPRPSPRLAPNNNQSRSGSPPNGGGMPSPATMVPLPPATQSLPMCGHPYERWHGRRIGISDN